MIKQAYRKDTFPLFIVKITFFLRSLPMIPPSPLFPTYQQWRCVGTVVLVDDAITR